MFGKRIKKLQLLLDKEGLDSALITHKSDIFYYTGFDAEEGAFLVINTGRPKLLVSPLLNEAENVKNVDVFFYNKSEDIQKQLNGVVGFDESSLKAGLFLRLKKKAKLKKAKDIIKKPRELKDVYEIEQIKKGIKINKKILNELDILGRRENAIAREIEIKMLEAGGEKAFDIIIASGKNSSYIHYKPKGRIVRKNGLIIVDFGARLNNYCTDMTRAFCFNPGKKEKGILDDVKNMQEELIEKVCAGINFKQLQNLYSRLMGKKGYKTMHSVGHGVGLDVHERPAIGDTLKENMVITIEPGIYIKNFGGCRIEDMILVKKGKAKVLS